MYIVYLFSEILYLVLALRIVEDIDELFEETLFGHISL